MATSELEIVNNALINIGEDTISSFEENRKAARLAKQKFAFKRDALIRRYRWNFAVSRATLGPESPPPSFGFENRFMLPDDSLRFIGIYDPEEPQQNYTSNRKPHKVEGRFVFADGDTLEVIYLKQVTDPTQFDALFDDALAYFLAIDLAYPLSTGAKQLKEVRTGFADAIAEAKRADAIEGSPEVIVASDWIDSRFVNERFPLRIGPVI